ncbi:hypothetical protein AXF42_Ash017605 [Apostasia shenzhenica]|uniref:Uncharacterized protein n=1 Tax=Apostasia shenzhenica TaxID=1088818 RepID=A0A2I0A5B5_9ASPA|nr:hypothetical protein AXF42_Ash017605 [Apostasia shenzhenica]
MARVGHFRSCGGAVGVVWIISASIFYLLLRAAMENSSPSESSISSSDRRSRLYDKMGRDLDEEGGKFIDGRETSQSLSLNDLFELKGGSVTPKLRAADPPVRANVLYLCSDFSIPLSVPKLYSLVYALRPFEVKLQCFNFCCMQWETNIRLSQGLPKNPNHAFSIGDHLSNSIEEIPFQRIAKQVASLESASSPQCFSSSKLSRTSPEPNRAFMSIKVLLNVYNTKLWFIAGRLNLNLQNVSSSILFTSLCNTSLYHFSMFHASHHLIPVRATDVEIEAEASAVKAVAESFCPLEIVLDKVVLTSTGVLLGCWQVISGPDPVTIRSKLRAALPHAPEKQLYDPVILHTSFARLLGRPKVPLEEMKRQPVDLLQFFHQLVARVNSKIHGFKATITELWFVEEYDVLALALDGRMKVRKFSLSCANH